MEVALRHLERRRITVEERARQRALVCLLSLPCASRPALLGEAAMRHKDQDVVGVRYPDPAKDTHLSYQLILPPLSTGPNQTHTEDFSVSCHSSDLLLKSAQPVETAAAFNDGRTILTLQTEILKNNLKKLLIRSQGLMSHSQKPLLTNLVHITSTLETRVSHVTVRLISLTPKATEILFMLVTNAGQLVEKDELLKEVWPDTFVEESNLTQNIFILRGLSGMNVRIRSTSKLSRDADIGSSPVWKLQKD